jgi:hypothetical protein
MTWKFDQAPNVACIASQAVVNGSPVLVVTHYEDDHSWSFLGGELSDRGLFDPAEAFIVAMSEVLSVHPELIEIANLPTGWTASRVASDQPWLRREDE